MQKLTSRVGRSDPKPCASQARKKAKRRTHILTKWVHSCRATIALTVILASISAPTHAAHFVFDVLYFGSDMATLAPGSDDPTSTSLAPSDTFQWSIAAQNGGFWEVVTGGDFFPLMAFSTNPGGVRTGDFDLQLLNNGSEVLSLSEAGVVNEFVHIGTNTVTLSSGLIFDEMRLHYLLTQATEDPATADDPNDLLPVETALLGLLPIFGAPENNEFSPGITYSIPEPSTLALSLFGGMALVASARRRLSGSTCKPR